MSILRKVARSVPPLVRARQWLQEFSRRDEMIKSLYQKIFERGRLKLPTIAPEALIADGVSVELPLLHPLFAGEDAPLVDLLFLLGLAKSRKVRRILEVGTYRARTTLALHQNCPEAEIVSYDVQVLPSNYRTRLEHAAQVHLRHGSFAASAECLMKEKEFDFIFVDGAHDVRSVCQDSRLAFNVLAPNGIIIWHDYRYNGYSTRELRVPEGLELVRTGKDFFHVSQTTCAVYCASLTLDPR